MIVLEMRITDQ